MRKLKKYKVMKTQENEHIYADIRKNMNSEEFEKSIKNVVNDYNISKDEKVVQLFKLGLYPTDIIEHIRVGLAEVYYILDLANKEGKFNDK
jgi:glutathione peroxidase-family protein